MHTLTNQTPFGWLQITSNGAAVTAIQFILDGKKDSKNADDVSRETWQQIEEYSAGTRTVFSLPLDYSSSPKRAAWLQTLAKVAYGDTITYTELAHLRGMDEKAARAAGSACAKNPIPLIIPCHRITRHDGSLGNFGGFQGLNPQDPRNLALKQALITHETA